MQRGFFAFFVFTLLSAAVLSLFSSSLVSAQIRADAVSGAIAMERDSFARFMLDAGTDFHAKKAVLESPPEPDAVSALVSARLHSFYSSEGGFFPCSFTGSQSPFPFLSPPLFSSVVVQASPKTFFVRSVFSGAHPGGETVCRKLGGESSSSLFMIPRNYSVSMVVVK